MIDGYRLYDLGIKIMLMEFFVLALLGIVSLAR